MVSEASWQTSNAGQGASDLAGDQPMDQRTVESLLRRLVERVEESERRYGEALDELHARLDQLSQTTEAASQTGSSDDAETFSRLHAQVSNLARRLEQETSTPLDDFERLGKALQGGLRHDLEDESAASFEPSPFAQAAMAKSVGEPATGPAPGTGYPDFGYTAASPTYSPSSGGLADNLDKRLVEMAQRLEESIGTAMPTSAIEALNARLDAIGKQIGEVLDKAPTREALAHVEKQISEMGQQLSRAEAQLAKVGGIEAQLLKVIERLDETTAPTAQLETLANKAATEAANRVAAETKRSAERLDAMHRDLTAMSAKSRASDDRLVSTLEAVHESLKQLVQQVERGAPAFQAKPRGSFLERARQAETKPAEAPATAPMPQQAQAASQTEQAKTTESAEHPKGTLRDRLGAAIPDFKEMEMETPPPFGRASPQMPDEQAVDLDAASPTASAAAPAARTRKAAPLGQDQGDQDDLVAAARRAAQAAAMRAEERGGRRTSRRLAGSAPAGEQQGRRKRPVLIIAAAVLLILSAILLYGRLSSKPETPVPAATEETAPADDSGETTAPGSEDPAPATEPEKSGSWDPSPTLQINPPENVGQATTGFTEMAKSPAAMPQSEIAPEPRLAALKPDGETPALPGVVFSIEDPTAGEPALQMPPPFTVPSELPLPPEALGPLGLREAAAKGDPKAQYAIAIRYADGKGVKRDLKEAATWFERAAQAGLAPAQYRLAAMYERGLGVDKDSARAREWYAAAAERGNVKAMHNLAVSVSGRDGGTPDYALAAKWYSEAAARGLADSQFNLGILAEHGLGRTKSLSDAYMWFALAAASGDAEAAKRREVIRVQLAPATLEEAEAAVKAWKPQDTLAEANEVAEEATWAANAAPAQNTALVSRAQTLLNQLGYDVGPPDGIMGSRTRMAVKLFQQRNGMQETGEVSEPLVSKLEHLSS